MEPAPTPWTDQVTAVLVLPATCARNDWRAPAGTATRLGATLTETPWGARTSMVAMASTGSTPSWEVDARWYVPVCEGAR